MEKQRRHFSGADKVVILKKHLIDHVPVSKLCEEHDLYATQFYAWLKSSSRMDTSDLRQRPHAKSSPERNNTSLMLPLRSN